MIGIGEVAMRYYERVSECGPRPTGMSRDEWFEHRAKEMRCFPTPAEERLAELLAERKSWHFVQQQRIGDYIVDFCDEDAHVVIEVDGSSHDGRAELDAKREADLRGRGYQVVRCHNAEVFRWPDGVLFRVVYARVAAVKARQSV